MDQRAKRHAAGVLHGFTEPKNGRQVSHARSVDTPPTSTQPPAHFDPVQANGIEQQRHNPAFTWRQRLGVAARSSDSFTSENAHPDLPSKKLTPDSKNSP
jgi:hypothetical protein